MPRHGIEKGVLALPIIGAILILPPVTKVFDIDVDVFGVPFPVIYMFVVWTGLIIGAAVFASRLRLDPDGTTSTQSKDDTDEGHN